VWVWEAGLFSGVLRSFLCSQGEEHQRNLPQRVFPPQPSPHPPPCHTQRVQAQRTTSAAHHHPQRRRIESLTVVKSTMVYRKKIDNRIRTLIQNGVKQRHRSLMILVGDKGKDQVVNLHYMLSKELIKRPSVLWCYEKELGFSGNRQKRMKILKKKLKRGG
jgi:tRNA(Met) cytidine acetyltransferase TmcA, N-terminal